MRHSWSRIRISLVPNLWSDTTGDGTTSGESSKIAARKIMRRSCDLAGQSKCLILVHYTNACLVDGAALGVDPWCAVQPWVQKGESAHPTPLKVFSCPCRTLHGIEKRELLTENAAVFDWMCSNFASVLSRSTVNRPTRPL